MPQETTLDSAVSKSYLRDNVFDAYAQDDWRVLSNLTLNYGVRYEFFAPYTEKYGHLADVDTNPARWIHGHRGSDSRRHGAFSGNCRIRWSFRSALRLRRGLGLALRLPKQTVVRAGFGMNYTVGQYATFATTMAHQPPFANEQTNQEASANGTPTPPAHRPYR